MLDARHVARLLGGEVIGRDQVIAPGPGHSRKDKSLSVRLAARAPDGFLVFSFSAGDDWKECRDFVRERLGLPPWQPGDGQDRRIPASRVKDWDRSIVDAEADKGPRWTEDDIRRINQARAIWRDGVNPVGTLAAIYLEQHRRIELPDTLAGTVLRFHPACPWHDENVGETIKVPALIAAFRQIGDNTITAVQRARLDGGGHKIDRRMLGITRGAAIKFGTPDISGLAVGEGVETCLAAMQLGFRPAWALGSCGSVARLPVIDGVKQITLLGENDAASAEAVSICGSRWLRAGRKVRVATPDAEHKDFNDELMARAAP